MGTGQTVSKDVSWALDPRQLKLRLTELLHRLEQMEAVVSVSSAALRHQNCERDMDVARVLQREVGDKLSMETDKLHSMLRALDSAQRKAGKLPRRRK